MVDRESASKDLLAAILLGFIVIVVLGILAVTGQGPIALQDLQTFLNGLDHPTPLTDIVHFAIGFITALVAWTIVTQVPVRRRKGRRGAREIYERIKVRGHTNDRRVGHALELFVLLTAIAFAVIFAKEFTFDIWVEGASVWGGIADLASYAVGFVAGIAAMLFAE